ncbi:MAG: hypothetical protein AAGJ35_09635, partial [Myxococcota bacterium]
MKNQVHRIQQNLHNIATHVMLPELHKAKADEQTKPENELKVGSRVYDLEKWAAEVNKTEQEIEQELNRIQEYYGEIWTTENNGLFFPCIKTAARFLEGLPEDLNTLRIERQKDGIEQTYLGRSEAKLYQGTALGMLNRAAIANAAVGSVAVAGRAIIALDLSLLLVATMHQVANLEKVAASIDNVQSYFDPTPEPQEQPETHLRSVPDELIKIMNLLAAPESAQALA